MKVGPFQDMVDCIGLLAVLVNAIERVVSSVHRQRWDAEGLAVERDGGDARGDAQTNVVKPSEFIHISVNFLRARLLQTENGFCVVEDYDYLL